MSGAIFHSPGFVERFLSGDQAKLDWVVDQCQKSKAWSGPKRASWKLFPSRSSEAKRYPYLCQIFNTIKRCVEAVKDLNREGLEGGSRSDVSLDFNDDPDITDFQDGSRQPIRSDEADTEGLKPGIVRFEDGLKHWENVRMPIEVKPRPGHHKAAIQQLTCYARAMFAHQLNRRHVFALVICGDEATFVLFDRAGILYSSRINLRTNSDAFTRAFASLLMLDHLDEGYDPAFETIRCKNTGRLKYYIHLPKSALEGLSPELISVAGPSTRSRSAAERPTRRFEVIEKLCHRKSIRGRATIVLRLRAVTNSNDDDVCAGNSNLDNLGGENLALGGVRTRSKSKAMVEVEATVKGKRKRKRESSGMRGPKPLPADADLVLKIIWRDPARESEGELMERLDGRFGLAQRVWHSDVMGRCRCSPLTEGQCRAGICVDETVQVDELQVCDNLQDIAVGVPAEDADGNLDIDTTQCHAVTHRRTRRVYSYILMSSIGAPLGVASNPATFMTAVLDAILGYWQLVNLGFLHRDVSYGNVMMLGGSQKFDRKRWKEPYTQEATNEVLAESERVLREVLDELDRNPSGMLSDFDLHGKHVLTPDDREWGSKKRKTGPSTSARVQHGDTNTGANRHHSKASQAREAEQLRDFRTGTPPFMSCRVLEVETGQKYRHNLLDDLESFFWVIFWSAAAHLDDIGSEPNKYAQHALDALGDSPMPTLRKWKYATLAECSDESGRKMKATLKQFGNTWASDPIFVNTLVPLGDYFTRIYRSGEVPSSDSAPLVFSEVVKIIRSALSVACDA